MGEFNQELKDVYVEIDKLTNATMTDEDRKKFSEPGKNYYAEMLKVINSTDYPRIHTLLSEIGAIDAPKVPIIVPVTLNQIAQAQAGAPTPAQPAAALAKTGNLYPGMLRDVEVQQVKPFIDKARKNITSFTPQELEKGLQDVLKIGKKIIDPEYKTTIFAVSEKVAQTLIKSGQFNKAYEIRMQTALAITPALPFANLHLDLAKAHPKLGLRLQPLDSSLFKNQALTIQRRDYGNNVTKLYAFAKLGHTARAQIQTTFDRINANPKELLKALPAGFCTDVSANEEDLFYQGRVTVGSKTFDGHFTTDHTLGYRYTEVSGWGNSPNQYLKERVIEFKGVGKVKIGNNPGIRAEYNKLSIELDPSIPESQASAKMSILLAALGLGAVTSTSRSEDIERIKVMQLFRGYYPKQAYAFEREAQSFEESVESLKARIEANVPDMKGKFKHYLTDHPELIYQQEVYPGQFVWSIKGLGKEARDAGAVGLMAGITAPDNAEASKRVISMLKLGSLSTQDRFQNGITISGASSASDLRTGGGESVFVRMFTKGMQNMGSFPFEGNMQLLYDIDLVERVGFAYSDDQYGTKDPISYKIRSNIVDLAKQIQGAPSSHKSNEVCIRNRIAPQYIKAIKVGCIAAKNTLVAEMILEGLITKNAAGIDCFNGIPLDKFIVIGTTFKAEYWA